MSNAASPLTPESARTAHVRCWIFDLDNTLYPASSNLFPQIHLRMRDYISDRFKISADEALVLQKKYFREYGTTLRGLMLVDGVDPDEFLRFVHDIDHSILKPAPRLRRALERLPGRRLVYTNGSEDHARRVLQRLGLEECFDAIFDIAAANYIPKPAAASFAALMAQQSVEPTCSAMFEDIPRNLEPASRLGMVTVLVRDKSAPYWGADEGTDTSFVDFVTPDLADWLDSHAAIP